MRIFFLLLCFLCSIAFEGQSLPSQAASLPPGSILEADFIQYRHLNGIPKPIKSEGSLVLWDGKGLLWKTSTPFPNSILITKKGMYQLQNKIKMPMMKTGNDNAIFEVMAGIFNIQINSNVKGFNVIEHPPLHGKWKIRLIPQYRQVQSIIASITVEGDKYIRHISIYRPNGDHDEIDVKDHSIKNEEEMAELKELFS